MVDDILYAADELRTVKENIRIRLVDTVLDLVGSIAEVQGDRDRACLQDTEVDRQPLEAVHQEDGDLLTLLDAAGHKKIGNAVRLFVKDGPGDLSAVKLTVCRLNQFIFFPGHTLCFGDLGVDLYEGNVVAV